MLWQQVNFKNQWVWLIFSSSLRGTSFVYVYAILLDFGFKFIFEPVAQTTDKTENTTL